ncbi:hypothetical protein B484DRAFT_37132, partial [Ochromonadaceae sp. CCMP2298]
MLVVRDVMGKNRMKECSNRGQCHERVAAMNFLFRATSDEWRARFCPNLIINYEDIRTTLLTYAVDSSALREGHAEWGMRKALRLTSLVVVLGGSGKDQAMAAALRGEFSAFDYSKLSILSFVTAGASKAAMWTKGTRSEEALGVIASGLRNLDTWMQGTSCEEYEGASAELATSLTQDVDVWSATDNVLVLFIVSHMLAAFYTELRKSKNSVTFPEVFATTGKDTAELYRKFVGRLLEGARTQDAKMNFSPRPHNVFYDEMRGAHQHISLAEVSAKEGTESLAPRSSKNARRRERNEKQAQNAAAAAAALATMSGYGGGGGG